MQLVRSIYKWGGGEVYREDNFTCDAGSQLMDQLHTGMSTLCLGPPTLPHQPADRNVQLDNTPLSTTATQSTITQSTITHTDNTFRKGKHLIPPPSLSLSLSLSHSLSLSLSNFKKHYRVGDVYNNSYFGSVLFLSSLLRTPALTLMILSM